jgi:hypothetical protein
MQYLYIWETGHIDVGELQDSLARALDAYPAVAGRLVDGGKIREVDGEKVWSIKFTNDGVPLKVVSGYPGSVVDIPSGEDGPPFGVFADDPASINAFNGGPLLSVRLTQFESGGCILGLLACHGVFDGTTFANFMRDWSVLHAGGSVPAAICTMSPKLFQDASDETMEAMIKSEEMVNQMQGWKYRLMLWIMAKMMPRMMKSMSQKRCIIHFNEHEMRALKSRAQIEAGTWVSTNEALIAHLHPLMLDAFEVPKADKVASALVVSVRGKIPEVPDRSVGNPVLVLPLVYDVSSSEKPLIAQVHEQSRSKLSENNLLNAFQVNNRAMSESKAYVFKALKRGTPGVIEHWNYQVALPYSEVDFGLGKPSRMQPWALENGVKVMKALDGGVDVMLLKGTVGIGAWTPNRFGHLCKGLSMSQLILICGWLRKRRSTSLKQLLTGCALMLMAQLVKKLLGTKHEQRVEKCFTALTEHPRLREFMKRHKTASLGGA